MKTGAIFSPCRRWRYVLWRRWAPGPACAFIGLNPSTADETKDDNTIRRCIAYARDWGFGAYWMLNIFAWRSTDPKGLYNCEYPVGLMNNHYIVDRARKAGRVVLAWGNHGNFQGRGFDVASMLTEKYGLDVMSFGITRQGQPKHPLYLKRTAEPKDLSIGDFPF